MVAPAAVLALLAWPLPTLVAGFVFGGSWLIADAELRRALSWRHHRTNQWAARSAVIAAAAAGVGAGAAAAMWPWTATQAALGFVLVAAAIAASIGGRPGRPARGAGQHGERTRVAVVPVRPGRRARR